MDDREIKNAKISGTMLGYEDHGILTCMISLDYGGGGQGFGGYGLDAPRKENGKFIGRFGTAYGMEFIARILKAVGVDKWEDLKGKHVRVGASWTKVCRIGHIIEDKWFNPDEDLKEFIAKEKSNAA